MEIKKERILFGLKCWGNRAYKELLLKDIPAVVLSGNSICRISFLGMIELISKVSQSKYKIRQRSY